MHQKNVHIFYVRSKAHFIIFLTWKHNEDKHHGLITICFMMFGEREDTTTT